MDNGLSHVSICAWMAGMYLATHRWQRLRGRVDLASEMPLPRPVCDKPAHSRMDAHTPEVQVADWSQPLPVASLNTACPEDAIAISADGNSLYFLFTVDLLDNLFSRAGDRGAKWHVSGGAGLRGRVISATRCL